MNMMTIDEAAKSLENKLNDADRKDDPTTGDVFHVRHNGTQLVVTVEFIYRKDEVPKEHEGYPVSFGRISCW